MKVEQRSKPIFSIVICTYNRFDFLESCLESIRFQLDKNIEILIIDNFGDKILEEYVSSLSKNIENIFYIFEKNKGLSFARNKGFMVAKSDWILYLDDDTIIYPEFILRVKELIKWNIYDCVGGMYYAKYKKERPKWIPVEHGTNKLFSAHLSECPYYIPHGCVVLYRKAYLIMLNGFSIDFGMKGKEFGYAEETELQYRLEKVGGKIGFDPELKVGHFIHEDRLTPFNMIKLNYALGRGHRFDCKFSVWKRFKLLVFSFVGLFVKRIPEALFKLIFFKHYYWQRAIIYIFGPTSYHLGRL